MTRSPSAVIVAPRTVELRDVPVPAPDQGEVVVEIAGCGVCGSDAPVWEGRPWFEYPLPAGAPGHEAWGTVAAVGATVARAGTVAAGDSVALLSTRGFARHVVAPIADVVALPPPLAGIPFPGEALGCGFNVARRSRIAAGSTVAVIGIGFLGAVVVALAARAGARVLAVARRAESLELARAMGATDVMTMDDHVVDAVETMTAGSLCATVVEATGAQAPLDLAGALTGPGGRLVVAGYHQDGPRTVDMRLWNWRGIDVINAHERDPQVVRQGVLDAAAAVVDGWFDPAPLYTHRFPLAEVDRALDAIVARPPGFVKALVTA